MGVGGLTAWAVNAAFLLLAADQTQTATASERLDADEGQLIELEVERPMTSFEGSSVASYELAEIGSLAQLPWGPGRPSFKVLQDGRPVYWAQCEQRILGVGAPRARRTRLICVFVALDEQHLDLSLVLDARGRDPLDGWLHTKAARYRVHARPATGVWEAACVTEGLDLFGPRGRPSVRVEGLCSYGRTISAAPTLSSALRSTLLPLALVFSTWRDARDPFWVHQLISPVAPAFVLETEETPGFDHQALGSHMESLLREGRTEDATALSSFARTIARFDDASSTSKAAVRLFLSLAMGVDGLGLLRVVKPAQPARDLQTAGALRAQFGVALFDEVFVFLESQAWLAGWVEAKEGASFLAPEPEGMPAGLISGGAEWLPVSFGRTSLMVGLSAGVVFSDSVAGSLGGRVFGSRVGLRYDLLRRVDKSILALLLDVRLTYLSLRPDDPSSPALQPVDGLVPGATFGFRFTL